MALVDRAEYKRRQAPPGVKLRPKAFGRGPPHADHESLGRLSSHSLREPAEPLGPRDCGVRGRGRGEHEQLRVTQRSLLKSMLRALPEDSLVRGLADERDAAGSEVRRDGLDALTRPREVGRAQVARSARRPAGGVRQTDPVPRKLSKLLWLEQARREPGGVEQSPEVVAGIRERRAGCCARSTRVDPAEDHAQSGREDVGNGRFGQAASGSRASSRSSSSMRRRSPTSPASTGGQTSAREHLHGVLGVAPAVAALVALRLAERPEPLHPLAG